jgi:hypothetical protein
MFLTDCAVHLDYPNCSIRRRIEEIYHFFFITFGIIEFSANRNIKL